MSFYLNMTNETMHTLCVFIHRRIIQMCKIRIVFVHDLLIFLDLRPNSTSNISILLAATEPLTMVMGGQYGIITSLPINISNGTFIMVKNACDLMSSMPFCKAPIRRAELGCSKRRIKDLQCGSNPWGKVKYFCECTIFSNVRCWEEDSNGVWPQTSSYKRHPKAQ